MQLCMQMAPTGHTQEARLSGPLARAVRQRRRGRGRRGEGAEEGLETKCIYMQNTNKTLYNCQQKNREGKRRWVDEEQGISYIVYCISYIA